MTNRISNLALLAAGAVLITSPALAHRQRILPSATILSGDDPWVTVDAAVSNDLFDFDHQPMRTTGIRATAPDGSDAKIENAATGRYRSTFDVHLTQKGTYRIENSSNGVIGSYTLAPRKSGYRAVRPPETSRMRSRPAPPMLGPARRATATRFM